MFRKLLVLAGVAAALSVVPSHSFAQFNGHNTRGDYGLQSATQPDPGLYVLAPMYVRYDADILKDSNGQAVSFPIPGVAPQ